MKLPIARMPLRIKAPLFLLVFVLAITAPMGFILVRFQERHLQENLPQSLNTLARSTADGIARFLDDTLYEAQIIAAALPPEALAGKDVIAIEKRLRTLPLPLAKFRNGFFLLDREGVLWADYPVRPETRGRSFAFREYFQRTMREGHSIISQPYRSARTGEPVLTFTVPLLGPDGANLGLLGCSVMLNHPEALGGIGKARIGRSGYLYLFGADRLMILHPDPVRVLERDIPRGSNRLLDRALDGYDGVGETVDSRGVPMVLAVAHVPGTDWILGAQQPQEEAYAPIRSARRLLFAGLAAAVLLTMAIGMVLLRTLINPILALSRTAGQMSAVLDEAHRPLTGTPRIPTKGGPDGTPPDEIGQLSRLLEELHTRLRQALTAWELTFSHIPDAIFILDRELRIRLWNRGAERLFGGNPAGWEGASYCELLTPETRSVCERHLYGAAKGEGDTDIFELAAFARILEVTTSPIRAAGREVSGLIHRLRDVTNQKGAEQALRESEEKFRLVVEQANDGILVAQEGRLRYVNPRLTEISGYTYEEHLDRPLTDFVHHEDRAMLSERHLQRLRGELPPSLRYRFRGVRKDGRIVWLEVTGTLSVWEGQPASVNFLTDITDRVRAESEVNRRIEIEKLISAISTEFLGLGPERFNSGIETSLRRIGEFAGADRSYLFLFSEDGRSMSNTHEWCAPGIEPQIHNLRDIPIDTVGPWFAARLRHHEVIDIPDVSRLPAEAAAERTEFERQAIRSLVCVPMVQGDATIGFVGFDAVRAARVWSGDDIAQLRIVGEIFVGTITRQRAEAALQRSEQRFKEMAEALPQGVFEIDERGRFTYLNSSGLANLGYTAADLARGLNVSDIIVPADRDRARRDVAHRLRNEPVVNDEFIALRSDGTTFPGVVHSAPILHDGRVVGLRGIVIDISDRQRLEAERAKAQKLESLGVLAGGLAHDFNNLLAAILANVSLARLLLEPGHKADPRLEETEKAVKRASTLTQQLLTFARGGTPVRSLIDVAPVLRETCAFALRGTALSCEFSLAPDLKPVEADEGQLGQALQNIVINARQAMSGEGTIGISAENVILANRSDLGIADGEYVGIAVKDQGGGIPAENLPRIFDPYFSTKEGGSGLGLAISYSVIRNHGGAITVQSKPGRGSTFTLYLPAADRELLAVPAVEPTVVRGSGSVLVMDDEEAIRIVCRDLLVELGYESTVARDGAEAIRLYREALAAGRPFSVVILDLTVPGGLGGKETVREILALDPAAKVIVSSGYSTDPVLSEYWNYGFLGILPKPYRSRELNGVLQRVLAD